MLLKLGFIEHNGKLKNAQIGFAQSAGFDPEGTTLGVSRCRNSALCSAGTLLSAPPKTM
jgi:hypothetical protein